MSALLRSHFSTLPLLAIALAAVLAGCDSNNHRDDDFRDDPYPAPTVRDFELDFDVAEADFSEDGTVASLAVEAPELDVHAVEDGLVVAYVRVENAFGERVWRALPYTYGVEFEEDPDGPGEAAVDYTVALGFAYEVDLFEVFYEISETNRNDDFVWDQIERQGARRIRAVVFSEEAVRRNQALDFNDYEAVQRQFNLNP